MQFIPADDDAVLDNTAIEGELISDEGIEKLLKNLGQAPLGLDGNQDFRISVAGAQEKTALLFYKRKWRKPQGTTPTTHILKTQIGALPNGIDLSNSVENEYFCLKLLSAFDLPVNAVEIRVFGNTKALVIERFDRTWTIDGRLLRVPQEDCCQALSIPPARKYQNEGGPGMVDILTLLRGSDTPADDLKTFLKAQILFWLIGATDGHGKNFSIFLGPRGRFNMTPLYDILTAQPSMDARQIVKKQMKLAMSVGDKRHYTMDYIQGRHFVQTVKRAGLPEAIARNALEEVAKESEAAWKAVEKRLPAGFPEKIYTSVRRGFAARMAKI